MTTPSSGAISLLNIHDEFNKNGPTPYSINDYYAGGLNVPSFQTGVPSSGQISFDQFYNKQKRYRQYYTFTTNTQYAQYDMTFQNPWVSG